MKDEYYGDDIVLKKYNISDTEERFHAIKESISELSSWLSFFKRNSYEADNANWIKQDLKNRELGTEYSYKVLSREDGTFLGEVRLNAINKNHNFCNLTYWTRSNIFGKGIVTKASRILIKAAFEDLKVNRVEIFMSVKNSGSKRVAEKLGAKYEGLMRNRIKAENEMQDAYLYSILSEDINLSNRI